MGSKSVTRHKKPTTLCMKELVERCSIWEIRVVDSASCSPCESWDSDLTVGGTPEPTTTSFARVGVGGSIVCGVATARSTIL